MNQVSQSFKNTEWGFWVRIQNWTLDEAALILCGVIPAEVWSYITASDDGSSPRHDYKVIDEHAGQEYLDLIERSFPKDGVSPKDFFNWCKDKQIYLHGDLLAEAAKIKSLNVNPADFMINTNQTNSPKEPISDHWGEIRKEIIHASLQVLNGLSRDEAREYFKPSGGLNMNKIAEHIHDNRFKWPKLKEEKRGTSLENLKKTLRAVVSDNEKLSSE